MVFIQCILIQNFPWTIIINHVRENMSQNKEFNKVLQDAVAVSIRQRAIFSVKRKKKKDFMLGFNSKTDAKIWRNTLNIVLPNTFYVSTGPEHWSNLIKDRWSRERKGRRFRAARSKEKKE